MAMLVLLSFSVSVTLQLSVAFSKAIMLKMSRTSWNNVIIFGVLALFLLFYIAPQQMAKLRDEQAPTIVPSTASVVQLRFSSHVLERHGPGWRIHPMPVVEVAIPALLNAWQTQRLRSEPALADALFARVCQVELLYSGNPQWQQWQLVTDQSQWYLQHQQALYKLHPFEAEALCPPALRR